MNQTNNYQLSQWDPEDRILRADFNSDNSKVDAALKNNAQAISDEIAARESADTAETEARTGAVATLTKELAKKGNCRIYCTTYTGNGSDSRTINFPAKPWLVMITTEAVVIVALQGATQAPALSSSSGDRLPVTWSGTSMTITGDSIIPNASSTKYYVTALIQVDA